MTFPQKDTSGGFPFWVRAVALLVIASLVGFFVVSVLI
jgi:hypothetical protein